MEDDELTPEEFRARMQAGEPVAVNPCPGVIFKVTGGGGGSAAPRRTQSVSGAVGGSRSVTAPTDGRS